MAERQRTIAIISSSRKVASTRRLEQVARARGHRVRILSPDDLQIFVDGATPRLLYKGKKLAAPDAVIPRIASSRSFLGAALVAQFERMGVYCLSSAMAIEASRNKLRSLQKLSRHGIALPETVFLSSRGGDASAALEHVGGAPVIIKLLEGTQGVGVMLADTVEGAVAILQTLRKTGQDVLLQRFVAESRGRDVRALVVGGEAVAAVRRVAKGTEFRSNVHRGSRAEPCTIEPAYAEAATRAAQILGLSVAGVDMLEGASGPLIVEVNSSPAIAAMEEATGLDLATPILELVETRLHHRPFDIVQRLSLREGYGVCELELARRSPLVGQTLAAAGLRELELQVLSVLRAGEVISGPRASFRLEPRDTLVMYGALEAARRLAQLRVPKGA